MVETSVTIRYIAEYMLIVLMFNHALVLLLIPIVRQNKYIFFLPPRNL